MSIGASIAIWMLFVTLSLFVVLPWGVRTADEAGEDKVPGSADSAPVNPMLRRKAFATLALGTVLFALYYANYVHDWVTIDDIPGWSNFRPGQGQK
jgi:predicted secreted protein